MFYAYGLYHSKSTNPTEQKAMMKWFKFGVVTSALTVLTYYAAINPTIQEWVTELTNQIQ